MPHQYQSAENGIGPPPSCSPTFKVQRSTRRSGVEVRSTAHSILYAAGSLGLGLGVDQHKSLRCLFRLRPLITIRRWEAFGDQDPQANSLGEGLISMSAPSPCSPTQKTLSTEPTVGPVCATLWPKNTQLAVIMGSYGAANLVCAIVSQWQRKGLAEMLSSRSKNAIEQPSSQHSI